jgi:hypothetical protein
MEKAPDALSGAFYFNLSQGSLLEILNKYQKVSSSRHCRHPIGQSRGRAFQLLREELAGAFFPFEPKSGSGRQEQLLKDAVVADTELRNGLDGQDPFKCIVLPKVWPRIRLAWLGPQR